MTTTEWVIDPALKEWASARQIEFIDLTNFHGSMRKAAQHLKLHQDAVACSIRALKTRAGIRGYSPVHDMHHTVPNGFSVKGISTNYVTDKITGEERVASQWVKTKLEDSLAEEAVREFVTWLAQDAKGKSPSIAAPKVSNDDLLAVYPMGDPHFGMLAVVAETGTAFDLDIAERQTKAAVVRLVNSAPPAKTAIIAQLGDFFHSDNESNRTGKSGNSLDVASRWSEVMQVGLRTMIFIVETALTKHQKVIVRNVKGNHDSHSSFALSLAMDAYFHNNKRVEVVVSNSAFWYYQFGKTLIGLTHGDTAKANDLPLIMASDQAHNWSATRHRYWYHGHIHNKQMKEFPGVLVESFRTLASSDAWHAAEGYRSGRDMHLIIHHKDHGEIERHRCDISCIA